MEQILLEGALTQFTLFRKLLAELRLKIFRDTFPIGRILRLYPSDKNLLPLNAHVIVPQALHICHDSRKEAQKVYKLLFASYHPFGLKPLPLVYFNSSIDSILYPRTEITLTDPSQHPGITFLSSLYFSAIRPIRRLTLDGEFC